MQRRFTFKAPRNEMPGPRDPRLKAYAITREMDRLALKLVGEGFTLEKAYIRAALMLVEAEINR